MSTSDPERGPLGFLTFLSLASLLGGAYAALVWDETYPQFARDLWRLQMGLSSFVLVLSGAAIAAIKLSERN